MSDTGLLPPFSAAVTQKAVETANKPFPANYIIEHILTLSKYLIKLVDDSNLFGKPCPDPYSASLHTLYDRLQNKQVGPSTLPSGFLSEERIHTRIYVRTDEEAVDRPLAYYEDLYYALVGRMQEMHQLLNLRINSGFNIACHVVFEGGPSIADLHHCMAEYWDVLNDPACGKALDNAIREAKVQALRDEIVWQVENDHLSHEDAQLKWAQIHSAEVYNSIVGLNFIQDWAPTMIGAYLGQKYRNILDLEKQEATFKAMQEYRLAKIKDLHRRVTLTGAPEVAGQEIRQAHDVRRDARQVRRRRSREQQLQARSSFISQHQNGQHQQVQAQMQYSPSRQHQVELHASPNPQAHTATVHNPCDDHDIEQERARQDQIHNDLQWQMKTQRVSEYSNYLRARASQDARHVVQSTRGSIAASSVASSYTGSSGAPVLTKQRGEIGYAVNDMDLSGYMQF
jgi:hypothetical protein